MQEKAQMSKNRPHIIALGAFLFMLSILVSPLRASADVVWSQNISTHLQNASESSSYYYMGQVLGAGQGSWTFAGHHVDVILMKFDMSTVGNGDGRCRVGTSLDFHTPDYFLYSGATRPSWPNYEDYYPLPDSVPDSNGYCALYSDSYQYGGTANTLGAGTDFALMPSTYSTYDLPRHYGNTFSDSTATDGFGRFTTNSGTIDSTSLTQGGAYGISDMAVVMCDSLVGCIVPPTTPTTCMDSSATNFNGALPCKYDTSTRIISVVPANGATVATGTVAFNITGYINANEYVGASSTTVNIGISNSAQSYNNSVSPYIAISQLGAPYQTWNSKNFQWVATSSGAFSFSTSTDIEQIGTYSMNSNISGPLLHILGWNILSQSLYSTSTSFLVATSTFQDYIIAGAYTAAQAVLNSSDQTCDSWLTGSSTFSSLPIRTAVYCFFAPTTLGLSEVFAHIQTSILAVPPLGYVTRAYEIMWSTGTTSLPVAHYVFPDYMPIVGGMEWDVPNWDVLFSTSTNPLLMTDLPLGAQFAGKSPAQVIEPIYDPIIYAIYIYLFIKFVIYKQSS